MHSIDFITELSQVLKLENLKKLSLPLVARS